MIALDRPGFGASPMPADTGHVAMLERPARFNADLRAFLEVQPGERTPWPSLRSLSK